MITSIENLHLLDDYKSRSITAENVTGEKGKAAMSQPNPNWPARNLGVGWKCAPYVDIPAGKELTLADIRQSGVIQSIWMAGEIDRGLVLRMYWDDQKNPAVEVPLTDFFLYGFSKPHMIKDGLWNSGPKYTVTSQLVCVNPNRGFNCFFQMPFQSSAKITIENRSNRTKCLYYQINYVIGEQNGQIGYFHAQYRSSKPVCDGVHTLLDGINGKGRYIGTAMYVGLNRNHNWWGEGEFKFYIDGDKHYPTICGTGLEDYFGGAFNWDVLGDYTTYQTPYMGMPYVYKPDGLYNIQQRFSMYRWHIVDPIRFQKDLRVTVQCLGWKNDDANENNKDFLIRQDDYITVSYWYQDCLDNNEVIDLPPHDSIICD